MAILKGQRAGSHSITVSYGGKTASATLTVNKIDPILQFTPRNSEITYNGDDRVIGALEYTGDGEANYMVIKATSQPAVPSASSGDWCEGDYFYGGSCISPANFEDSFAHGDSYCLTSPGGGYVMATHQMGSHAGTYYVFAKATEGTSYNAVSPKYVGSFTIGKANQAAPESADYSNVTYPNTAAVSSVSGGGGHGQVYYRSDPNGGTNYGAATTTPPSRSTYGTTTFIAYWGGDDDYNASPYSGQFSMIVYKRTVTITAPTFVSGTLTYNGSSQNLVNAGICTTGGTMYYYVSTSSTDPTSFSTSTWSTTVPAKTNSGQYYVWYYCYVSDTTNNTGTNINTILEPAHTTDNSKTINKATLPTPVMTSGYLATYNGSSVNAKASVSSKCATPSSLAIPAGKIYYGTTSGASTYNVTASTVATDLTSISRSDVGSTNVYAFFSANDPSNYTSSAVSSTTVKVSNKAANTVTYAVQASSVWCGTDASARSTTNASKTVTVATSSATATAGSITYAVSVKNSSNTTVNGWSVSTDGKTVTTSAATPAGVYTVSVTATAAATTNYSSGTKTVSSTVTVSAVSLSSVALTLASTSIAYSGNTTVTRVRATYNNTSYKDIEGSLGTSTNSNPKIESGDTTIATITIS